MSTPKFITLFLITSLLSSLPLLQATASLEEEYTLFENDIIQLASDIALVKFGLEQEYDFLQTQDLFLSQLTMEKMVQHAMERFTLAQIQNLLGRIEKTTTNPMDDIIRSFNICDFTQEDTLNCLEFKIYPKLKVRVSTLYAKYSL